MCDEVGTLPPGPTIRKPVPMVPTTVRLNVTARMPVPVGIGLPSYTPLPDTLLNSFHTATSRDPPAERRPSVGAEPPPDVLPQRLS